MADLRRSGNAPAAEVEPLTISTPSFEVIAVFLVLAVTETMAKVIEVGLEERRRDRRRPIMLEGRLEGHTIAIVDISFGGLAGAAELLGKSSWLPEAGREMELELAPNSGKARTFTIEIIRVDPVDGQFGARFLGLDDAQYRVIERLMMGRSI